MDNLNKKKNQPITRPVKLVGYSQAWTILSRTIDCELFGDIGHPIDKGLREGTHACFPKLRNLKRRRLIL